MLKDTITCTVAKIVIYPFEIIQVEQHNRERLAAFYHQFQFGHYSSPIGDFRQDVGVCKCSEFLFDRNPFDQNIELLEDETNHQNLYAQHRSAQHLIIEAPGEKQYRSYRRYTQ